MCDVHKNFHMIGYSFVTSEQKATHTGRIIVIDILKQKSY